MGRFVDTFHGAYIAAEDVGVDPQFVDWMALETKHVRGGITGSAGGDPSPHTARGTVKAMIAALAHQGHRSGLEGRSVAIQGVGHVGMHLARTLSEEGAKLLVSDLVLDLVEQAVEQFNAQPVPPEEILTTECDILAPCALGGVIDTNLARKLRCRIVAGAANNMLDDPDEAAVVLRNVDILYVPDFIANAGGIIQLAGTYLGMTQPEIDRKIDHIETKVAQVLQQAESMPSTHAAAIALANRRLGIETNASKERVHAG